MCAARPVTPPNFGVTGLDTLLTRRKKGRIYSYSASAFKLFRLISSKLYEIGITLFHSLSFFLTRCFVDHFDLAKHQVELLLRALQV